MKNYKKTQSESLFVANILEKSSKVKIIFDNLQVITLPINSLIFLKLTNFTKPESEALFADVGVTIHTQDLKTSEQVLLNRHKNIIAFDFLDENDEVVQEINVYLNYGTENYNKFQKNDVSLYSTYITILNGDVDPEQIKNEQNYKEALNQELDRIKLKKILKETPFLSRQANKKLEQLLKELKS